MPYPFSASSTERVVACPGSTALDQFDEVTEDGERGTTIHLFAKRVLQGWAPAAALQLVPKECRATCAGFDPVGALNGVRGARAEVAYAINVRTGAVRELGVDLDRAYEVEDGEVPGTLDVEGFTFTGRAFVGDWKSGYGDVTPCCDNLQMAFGAYARAELLSVDEVEARVLRIASSGAVRSDAHVFTRLELDTFLDTLAAAYDAAKTARSTFAAGGQLRLSTGSQCKYCPAIAACPAQTGLARKMVSTLTDIDARIAALTPTQGGEAYLQVVAAEALVERVKRGLQTYARQSPLPIAGGKELREIRFNVEEFSRERAVSLLREKGATDVEIKALSTEVERSQVRVLKARGAR